MDLKPGDPFPWIHPRTAAQPTFAVDAMAGRYLVFCFFGSMADRAGRAAVEAALANRNLFDDTRMSFFGVSCDPADEAENRVSDRTQGFHDQGRRAVPNSSTSDRASRRAGNPQALFHGDHTDGA